MLDILLVGVGGFVGANARFIVSNLTARRLGTTFPYGTLFINLTGSFGLGLLTTLASRNILADESWRWLLGVGFCGGYTTFSTYTYETLALARQGRWLTGGGYLPGRWGLGLAGVGLGVWLGSTF